MSDANIDGTNASRDWLTKLLSKLLTRFCAIYLLALHRRHVINVKPLGILTKQGDVVLVHDVVLLRLNWKLVLVTELYAGADGLARSAKGKIGKTLINRQVS